MGTVKAVWMQIIDGHHETHVKLFQDKTEQRLWVACCSVPKGAVYYYGAKISAWLPIFTKVKVIEDDCRPVFDCSVHRDIFSAMDIAKGVKAYKYFFEKNVFKIETSNDLQDVVGHYFQLDHSNLQSSEQHELGRFATECAANVASKPCAAAFIVYYLSCIYRYLDSMSYSNIQPCNALCILKSLQSWPLQQSLGSLFNRNVTQVMWNLVKLQNKSAGWDSFVFWCYPSLSSDKIFSKQDNTGYRASADLVNRLCSFVGQHEGAEHLLCAIVPYVTSLSALCQSIMTFNQSAVEGHAELLAECLPYFMTLSKQQLDKLHKTQHLKELCEIAAVVFSVDCATVNEYLPAFEQKLLQILYHREDVSGYVQHLEKIIKIPVLFSEKPQALDLLQTFARCSTKSHHSLLPRLLQLDKFANLVDCESLMQLIDQWLSTVSSVTCLLANDRKSVCHLCSYIFKMCKLPNALLKTEDVKKDIQNKCMKAFCDKALPRIRQMSYISELEVVENLVTELKEAGIQSFEHIQSAIEDAVTTIIQKATVCQGQYAQTLVHLLLHDKLFVEADCSMKVLESIAASCSLDIHAVFLQVMKTEKFWTIVQDEYCDKVCDKWLSNAITYHSVIKSKSLRCGRADYYILYLYDYLTDILVIPAVACSDTVRNRLEGAVKAECILCEPNAIIDLLDTRALEIKDEAVKLLELHFRHVEVKNVLSERDLHSKLDKLGDSHKKDWQAEHRYC